MPAKRIQHPDIDPAYVSYPRRRWFIPLEKLLKRIIKAPRWICLGEKPGKQCVILSNHEGAGSPLKLELHSGLPIRFWGAWEMNATLKDAYIYQSEIYFHQKKHWNLFLSRLFCLIAAPLTRMYYTGLELISTYPNLRFKSTLSKSIQVLQQEQTLVIFPEVSDQGYLKELTGFHPGAVMFLEQCLRHGLDVPVFVAYYKKATGEYVFDAPVSAGSLLSQGLPRQELARKLCDRCNELGTMEL